MATNLVDQELELDDSSPALVLAVTLHTCTAKAKIQLCQRKLAVILTRTRGENHFKHTGGYVSQ